MRTYVYISSLGFQAPVFQVSRTLYDVSSNLNLPQVEVGFVPTQVPYDVNVLNSRSLT